MENIIELLEKVKVSPKYALPVEDYKTIYECYKNEPFLLINSGFLAGYMQRDNEAKEKSK